MRGIQFPPNKSAFYTLLFAICLVMGNIEILSASVKSALLPANDSLHKSTQKFVDGPYIFQNKRKMKVVNLLKEGENIILQETEYSKDNKPVSFTCYVDNEDNDRFTFVLRDNYQTPAEIYDQPEKLLAISDIEGNFNAFYSLLVANHVMSEDYQWIFGEGHLVLTGDFMDRGNNVTSVLWLIYHLEQQAEQAGGMVHFILGNHEVMNIEGQTHYVHDKYLAIAKEVSGKSNPDVAYRRLYNSKQELVKWMKSKNAIEKVGDILFVHGGISPQLVEYGFSIPSINKIIRQRLIYGRATNSLESGNENFLFAGLGPLWYRGLAAPFRGNSKCNEEEVKAALAHFEVDHIAIGHTLTKEVSVDYDGKVLRTDVRHHPHKGHADSQALLVVNNQFFKTNANGEQQLLNTGSSPILAQK